MEIQSKEKKVAGISLSVFVYNNPSEAIRALSSIAPRELEEMASVYQLGFGGPPWWEKFKCADCGTFSSVDTCCPNCKGNSLGEAYPKDGLINNYFPKTLSEFTPGTLIKAKENGKVIGFTTGGTTELEELVKIKYGNKKEILDSIVNTMELAPNIMVFYDNETCVTPTKQQQGAGRILSQVRINSAIDLGTEVIVGRTINKPWLSLKKEQLDVIGYDFQYFVPGGDTYMVEGNPRMFYVARRK